MSAQNTRTTDPVTFSVLASRLDAIVREMQFTLQRAARSSVIALARDFSCSIVSAEDELLFSGEGLPVHVYGSSLLSQSMRRLHGSLASGDAFLHNDPYDGNTHAADHSLQVPIVIGGQHAFTAIAKAHQADIGNVLPTTYLPNAVDLYAEGALIFPCVQIQRDYQDVADVVRMCRRRIRLPDVWYGDYLAMLRSARLAEQRLSELCTRVGLPAVLNFCKDWLNYSEQRMSAAVSALPEADLKVESYLDPFPGMPERTRLRASISLRPRTGKAMVDLRDNPDCLPNGLNLTEATAKNSAIVGILISLNLHNVPLNSGSFRCLDVLVRENCVAGVPRHPASCSLATGEVGVRITAMIASGLAEVADGVGTAEAGTGKGPHIAVVSGDDKICGPYVTQIFVGTAGGPATAQVDGWLSFLSMSAAGLMYRDSVELLENRYPIVVWRSEIRGDSEGAGRTRGAPGAIVEFSTVGDPMLVLYSLDGIDRMMRGVRSGGCGAAGRASLRRVDGVSENLPNLVGEVVLTRGARLCSLSPGGGGYGEPFERSAVRVLHDVREGYVSVDRAAQLYGVAVRRGEGGRWDIDEEETAHLRRVGPLTSPARHSASRAPAPARTRHHGGPPATGGRGVHTHWVTASPAQPPQCW